MIINSNCQQFELYASEASIPRGREFTSVEEMQRWVDDLRENPWWERFYPQVLRVEAVFKPSGSCSCGGWTPSMGGGRIEMLPCHRNELVVCHELAHVLAAARFKSKAHCPWFAKTYLELVYLVMGTEAWTALRESFVAGGISFNPDPEAFAIGQRREMAA
jgi:putative metallohydrolase (TIGR04338 family)